MVSEAAALPTLRAIEPKPGFRLTITWARGAQNTVDFRDTIQRGGVFAALADEKLFTRVRMTADRRKIEWPDPCDEFGEPVIDIDAESLLVMARIQSRDSAMQRLSNAVRSFEKSREKGPTEVSSKPDQSS
jgi:hypothetical protein